MSYVTFDAEKHEYALCGEDAPRRLISVTQLLKKHGLAPDYSAVPEDVLSAKAERGTAIHAEIEDYIKFGEPPETDEAKAVVKWLKPMEKRGAIASEAIVYNDICAGTIDLVITADGATTIADFKTCYRLDLEAYRWQLSLYARLLSDLCGVRASKLLVVHASVTAKKLVNEITPIAEAEIDRLLECERSGARYTAPALNVEKSDLQALIDAENAVAETERQAKEATAFRDGLRAKLLAKMQDENIRKYEGCGLVLTRVMPSERETLDSKALRAEMPEIAAKYTKRTQVKESLRVTVKAEEQAV